MSAPDQVWEYCPSCKRFAYKNKDKNGKFTCLSCFPIAQTVDTRGCARHAYIGDGVCDKCGRERNDYQYHPEPRQHQSEAPNELVKRSPRMIFDLDELRGQLQYRLPEALRTLAEMIERSEIDMRLTYFLPNEEVGILKIVIQHALIVPLRVPDVATATEVKENGD